MSRYFITRSAGLLVFSELVNSFNEGTDFPRFAVTKESKSLVSDLCKHVIRVFQLVKSEYRSFRSKDITTWSFMYSDLSCLS